MERLVSPIARRARKVTAGLFALTLTAPALMVGTAHAGETMPTDSPKRLEVLGYLEHVRIEPLGVVMPAKLDTGATTSSIDASDLEPFKRNGVDWIRFTLPARGTPAKPVTLERKVVRIVRIKQHGRTSVERPVVEMTFCFGHQKVTAQISLADRTKYRYPLLLGRNHMRGHIAVDPGHKYTTEPDCSAD